MESQQRPHLRRQGIAEAAVRIADSEGLDAVTMRRLARTLGVEAMSLYHHISGKSALFGAMLETVFSEVLALHSDTAEVHGWKEQVRARCLGARTVMLRHPWAPGLLAAGGRAPLGVLRQYDAVLSDLLAGGKSYRQGHLALHALGGMIIGLASDPLGTANSGEAAPMSDAEQAQMLEACPHLTAMIQEEIHQQSDPKLGWCDAQEEFEFTLDLLLDGVERQP